MFVSFQVLKLSWQLVAADDHTEWDARRAAPNRVQQAFTEDPDRLRGGGGSRNCPSQPYPGTQLHWPACTVVAVHFTPSDLAVSAKTWYLVPFLIATLTEFPQKGRSSVGIT